MKPLRFYEHFACAFGTMILILFGVSLITESHINTGIWGLIGLPVISLVYAVVRVSSRSRQELGYAPKMNVYCPGCSGCVPVSPDLYGTCVQCSKCGHVFNIGYPQV